MASRVRTAAVTLVLAATLALTGCTSVNTDALGSSLDTVPGVNGSLIEVQRPGLPTSADVVIWLYVDTTDVDSVARTVRAVAKKIDDDPAVRGTQVSVAVVQGTPAQYSSRSETVDHAAGIMHVVAERLGLPKSAGGFIRLDAAAVAKLVQQDG